MKLKWILFTVWLILLVKVEAEKNKNEKIDVSDTKLDDENTNSKNDTKEDKEKLPDTITIVSRVDEG